MNDKYISFFYRFYFATCTNSRDDIFSSYIFSSTNAGNDAAAGCIRIADDFYDCYKNSSTMQPGKITVSIRIQLRFELDVDVIKTRLENRLFCVCFVCVCGIRVKLLE